MKMLRCIKTSLIAGVVGLYGSAYALSTGPYADINIGIANTADNSYSTGFQNQKKNKFAGGLNIGYMFMPNFGVEVGYANYNKVSYEQPVTLAKGSASLYGFDVALKGVYGLPVGPYLFAKAGIGYLIQDAVVNEPKYRRATFFWGGGVGYDIFMGVYTQLTFTQNVAPGPVPRVFMTTLGLGYKF
mgnify:CR=1 FL=1